MNATSTTKITRSMGATIGYFVAGLVAFALCVWLFKVGGTVAVAFALVAGGIGLALVAMAFSGAGVAPCPACGAPVSGLSTKDNDGAHCDQCHAYLEGKDGLLHKTDENRVADAPMFAAPLPEQFTFPPGCCVCGAPEARRDKISLTTTNASAVVTAPTIGTASRTTVSVEVPHCAEHKGGAALAGTAPNTRIRFRSYPYLRAFCRQNGITPG